MSALGDYQGALRETKLALDLNPYIPQPRYKLLIDLQFEEASVLAPELSPGAEPLYNRIKGLHVPQYVGRGAYSGFVDNRAAGQAVSNDLGGAGRKP